jgi:Tol biopolymer transport system component/DNA-binding winged helix-turn-helix (wHTH) protein
LRIDLKQRCAVLCSGTVVGKAMTSESRSGPTFRFGTFEADAGRATLTRNGATIKIQDQPFRVLIHLLEHAGAVVTRDELRQLLWGDETFVEFDASLNVILKKLRAALRDDSDNPRFVETVPRHGYRFIAPVAAADSGSNRAETTPNGPTPSSEDAAGAMESRAASGRRWWIGALQLTAVAVLAVSATVIVTKRNHASADSVPLVRSSILAPQGVDFVSTSLALSRDGQMLAFVANGSNGAPTSLWVEAMSSGITHPLTGTEGATLPFWSPDGQNIGFFAHGKLWRVGSEGGPPQPLCDAPLGRGGTWNQSGVIVFAPDLNRPLERISANGGVAIRLAPFASQSGTAQAWWPQFLPDGEHFIFWSHSDTTTDVDGIYLAALGSNERRLLMATESNGLYANGYLLYVHDQHLLVRPFDALRLRLGAVSQMLADGVGIHGGMHLGDFSASQNGLLAYFAGQANRGWPMVMYDRSGKLEGRIVPQQDVYLDPRFSRDGRRLALSISRRDTTLDDVWIVDVGDGTRTRITFGNGDATHPVWSADGNTMYYSSIGADRVPHTYARLTNGAADEKPLLVEAGVSEVPMDVSKDGQYLAYTRRENGKPWEIWMLPLRRPGTPYAFARSPHADIIDPAFSPDNTWVAYSADDSGTFNVYIAHFHGDGKWQVSAGGGTDPVWAPDGRRLYFIDNAENVMYVDVRASDEAVSVSKPVMFAQHATFRMPRPLAVAPDGRLLVDGHHDQAGAPLTITLLTNWPGGLRR